MAFAQPDAAGPSPADTDLAAGHAEHLGELLKALAHPVRLRIVAILTGGPRCVGELADLVGVRQAMASQQLRILRMSGLLQVTREGGYAHYALAEPRLIDLVDCLRGCQRR